MPVPIVCPECRAKLRLKSDQPRPRVTCPKCQAKFAPGSLAPEGGVASRKERKRGAAEPKAASSPATWKSGGSPADLMRAVAAAFHGKAVHRAPTLGYRFAILLCAFGLLALIVAYAGCGVAIGYGMYFYATHVVPPSLHLRGRAVVFAGLLHLGILGAGLAVLYSLVRPLFRRREADNSARLLTAAEQPIVHCFVRALCDLIAAPFPDEIRMGVIPNASAGRHGRILGIFGGKLVLDIGSPLFFGLPLRSLAGVIAHELGHFSQATSGGLLGYIGTVTNWFEEAVGRSSDIREAIRTGAEDNQGSAALIVWVAWCTTGLGVLLLSFFALLSRVVAFYLLRQMEFDADRYEAQVAGSAQFAKTFERLGQLEVGFENTIKAVFTGDLSPDSDVELAEQVVIDADNLSEKHLRRAARHLRPTRAQWFDSHPSPTDRIAAVAKLEEPGIFQLDGPARCLLRMQTLPIENAREIN